MKIGIFAYNFEHEKIQQGLLNLFLHNYKVSCILAVNRKKLNFYQSKIRIAPQGIKYIHPQKIAQRLNIPYYIVEHNSKRCENLIKSHGLDLGIILGARILKKPIISAFKIGIINLHRGLLPQVRGLDNIKWAIFKDIEQGATVHFIDEKIDRGKIILQKRIEIYKDDTLLDIYLRLRNLEQQLMIEALGIIENKKRKFKSLGEGNYFKAVSPEKEKFLLQVFEEYKKQRASDYLSVAST